MNDSMPSSGMTLDVAPIWHGFLGARSHAARIVGTRSVPRAQAEAGAQRAAGIGYRGIGLALGGDAGSGHRLAAVLPAPDAVASPSARRWPDDAPLLLVAYPAGEAAAVAALAAHSNARLLAKGFLPLREPTTGLAAQTMGVAGIAQLLGDGQAAARMPAAAPAEAVQDPPQAVIALPKGVCDTAPPVAPAVPSGRLRPFRAADNGDLTVIRSTDPVFVGKTYRLDKAGQVTKAAVAHIATGFGYPCAVPDARSMAALLHLVTEANDLAICNGALRGADGQTFGVVTERNLAGMLGTTAGQEVPGGVQLIGGKRVAARLKRGIDPTSWVLLDADDPEGTPDEWRGLDIGARLALIERIVPGISTCERIELRGSSSRVVRPGDEPGHRTHAWIRVSHPSLVKTLRGAVQVRMVTRGVFFSSPRRSRGTGEVIGHAPRTLIDLAPWLHGRLVFCARPVVRIDGYTVADAGIVIVNEGAGTLDISDVRLPDDDERRAYETQTGHAIAFSQDGQGVYAEVAGALTRDTPIEVRGAVKAMGTWLDAMAEGAKLRCEAPFRDSTSEAAFIRKLSDGRAFIFDIGNATKYVMQRESMFGPVSPDDLEDGAERDTPARATGLPDLPPQHGPLPPRPWLLGTVLLAGHITVLIAPGGVGKTSVALAWGLAVATGRGPDMAGMEFHGEPGGVLVLSMDDPTDELRRRRDALCKRHGIELPERLALYGMEVLAAIGLTRAERGSGVVDTHGVAVLRGLLARHRPRLLILDPLVGFSAGGVNDNPLMAALLTELQRMATESVFALLILHHERKGSAQDGTADASMGAATITNKARIALRLVRMTQNEAKQFRIAPWEADNYACLGGAKMNMAPSSVRTWFHLEGVGLHNGTPAYPRGDNVQAALPWKPVARDRQFTDALHRALLEVIARGASDGGGFLAIASNNGEPRLPSSAEAAEAVRAHLPPGRAMGGKELESVVRAAAIEATHLGWLTTVEVKVARQAAGKGGDRKGKRLAVVWLATPWRDDPTPGPYVTDVTGDGADTDDDEV
ncbi:AAA family ATPase [Roseomonas sp. CAU 1739]|uniref:AAA family ATPase n=1 Tax=Roseomonas sp. CAU 1739 TaxID=3140364 RepID=UPI00325BE9A5